MAFSSGTGEVPLLAFWLTMTPQVVTAAIFASCVFGRLGVTATKDIFTLGRIGGGGGGFWLIAGAAFWYGQFFTIQSMILGTPALAFIIKLAEPLSTSLLAGWVLRKPYSLPLLLGVLIACIGVMICVYSADHSEKQSASAHGFQSIGLVCAMLANLSFSSRACLAKKAMDQLRLDPCVAFGMMTIVSGIAGVLPILGWALTSRFGLGMNSVLCPFFDPRFSARSWLMMCLSYVLYQTCCIFILAAVAVESHALLVASKHVLLVVIVSLLVHAQLSQGILFGMALTLSGVYIYSRSIQKHDPKENEHLCDAQDHQLRATQILGATEQHRISSTPRALEGFVVVLVVIGASVAPLIAFLQQRNATAV